MTSTNARIATLNDLANRLDHQVALIRNAVGNRDGETRAGKLADEAQAIRWALRQIADSGAELREAFLRGNNLQGDNLTRAALRTATIPERNNT